jgi:Domian of unknown function (DUF4952)
VDLLVQIPHSRSKYKDDKDTISDMNKILFLSKIPMFSSLMWGEIACAQPRSQSTTEYLLPNIQSIAISSTGSFATTKGVNPYICTDFLKQWGYKPKELKFSDCKLKKHIQGDRLVSTYTVSGRNAKSVEKMLHDRFKMGKLHFMCCYWGADDKPGWYRDKNGYGYQILMSSGETLIHDWNQIEFTVTVTKFLVDP